MKKTSIDTSLLPNIWLTWETTKGRFYLECRTGKKTNLKPLIDFTWKNKNDDLVNSGSHPYKAYVKYHKDIDMLEIAAVTIDTTRKEIVHQWKYAGDKYFIRKDKVIFDENGNVCTGPFNLYQYHTARDFKNFLGMFHRLSYKPEIMKEFHKFIGGPDYTIGNGRVVDAQYSWHIQDWYVKKQSRPTTGKQQKLVDKLTDIPLSDVSGFKEKYPEIKIPGQWYNDTISNILYFERMEDGWSVLRMLKRTDNGIVESERMYLHDDGTNRIATKTKNGWIPAKQFKDYYSYYQFVNKDEAMEKCNRLKYIIPLFDKSEKNIKRYLMVALRFPEVEQFMKLGYTELANRIANSSTPHADLRHEFGEYYNEKETNLLRKVGMTKYQMDRCVSNNSSRNRYWYHGSALGDMRAWFGNDLSHLDNATFDKFYNAFGQIRSQAYGLQGYIEQLGLDNKRFLKNAIRLNDKQQHCIFSMIRDTMNQYLRLNAGTAPEVDWYFDSYSDVVRTHDAIDELKRAQDQERMAMWNLGYAERQKKEEEKRIKIDENRKKYEYEDDNYIIRLPNNGTEIVTEGSKQRICIGGYVSSHSLGNTNLFFIRRKSEPDIPFYAIEMKNGVIIQIHGYCNKWLGCDPEVIPTVVRWLRKNNIKCDEKILTCKATGYGAINDYVKMPVVD